jgi:uncharacterized RDD family membrane protein YckC
MPSRYGDASATLVRRGAACLVDLGVAGLLGGAASSALALVLAAGGAGDGVIEPVRRLTLLAAYGAYCVLPTASARWATLGQRWFDLELVGSGGGRAGLAEAFGRWLAFLAAALPLGAGLLLALGSDRRPFQDRICDSRVVRRSGPAAARPA